MDMERKKFLWIRGRDDKIFNNIFSRIAFLSKDLSAMAKKK